MKPYLHAMPRRPTLINSEIERSISMSDTPAEEIKDETENLEAEAEVPDAADETIEEAEITDEDAAEADEAAS